MLKCLCRKETHSSWSHMSIWSDFSDLQILDICCSERELKAARIVVAQGFFGTHPGWCLFALWKSTFWVNVCSLWCEDVSYSHLSPSNKMVLSGFSVERLIFHPCLFILSSLCGWNINAVKCSSKLCCPQGNWSRWRNISFPVIRAVGLPSSILINGAF